MACPNNVQPLQLPYKNVSLSASGFPIARGIAVEIGTPPQFLSLRPSTGGNNTFVFDLAACGSASNYSCTAPHGGVFAWRQSSTFHPVIESNWNGTRDADVDSGGTKVFFNDDILFSQGGEIYGYPMDVDSSQYGASSLVGCLASH